MDYVPPFIELSRHQQVVWVSTATIVTIASHHPDGSTLMLLNQSAIVVDQSPSEVIALLEDGWKAH